MGRTYKVPVEEVEKKQDVTSTVIEVLRNDPKNAYTIGGIMVEGFEVKEKDIENKSFSEWKKGQPTLYSAIRRTVDKLTEQGKLKQKKHGRATVYWWNEKQKNE